MSNTKNIPYVIKTNGSVTLYLSGECMTVAQDHQNYSKIVEALKAANFSVIENLINVGKAVTTYSGGAVKIVNGEVFYGNFAVHNTLTQRIISMMKEGYKFDHMLKFLENLMQNPSFRAVNETYTFLENHGLPITDDGCFLAYKAVRNNYTDIRTGTFDNHVGITVKMARNQVNENYHEDCSYGLHVGALCYVIDFGHFRKGETVPVDGNKLLIVKVNPKDVVSVPAYAGHTKMRVCEYVVVDEIKNVVKELDKAVYTSNATEIAPDAAKPAPANVPADSFDTGGEQYDEGFNAGRAAANEGSEYGVRRDYTRKGDYLKGYNDGYNMRDYNFPEDSVSDEDEGCCDDDCGCSCATADDDEFDAGYNLGTEDCENGEEYEANLELDASAQFKDGYHAGWNDADGEDTV